MMICRNCGRELPDDARFCARCGARVAPVTGSVAPAAENAAPAAENAAPAAENAAPAAENAAPAAENAAPAAENAAPAAENAAPAAEDTAPAQEPLQPQIPPPLSAGTPSWSSRPAAAPAPAPAPTEDTTPLRTGQFFLIDLICAIPLLNIVMLLIWAFSDKTNLNRKNLARARLIWVAIGIVISIALLAVSIWIMSNSYWYLRY